MTDLGRRVLARIDIAWSAPHVLAYRITVDGEPVAEDDGLSSLPSCLAAAVEALPKQTAAAELGFGGIVIGTYVLSQLSGQLDAIAAHALRTTAAVLQALQAPR